MNSFMGTHFIGGAINGRTSGCVIKLWSFFELLVIISGGCSRGRGGIYGGDEEEKEEEVVTVVVVSVEFIWWDY